MVTIKGIDELVVKLDKLDNLDMNKCLRKAGVLVMDSAKDKCPVDSGQLWRSITYEVDGNTCYIGTNVEYAPYVEFGTGIYATAGDGRQTPWKYQTSDGSWHTTSGQKAQPYLQPALNENKEQIRKIFKDGVKEEVDDIC